jgi:NarL family two-component system response regulator LiaR
MSQENVIRVLIVDDHAMVRSGLRLFLMAFDDLKLVGEGTNGSEAVRLAGKLLPDVVLMDLIMPTMDGVMATREIHSAHPKIKIIALTSFTEPQLIHDAIEAGVSGYLFKDASANELANAIRSAAAGNTIFSPEVTQALITHEENSGFIQELTAREREVLALMVAGKSNAEISEVLIIELSTSKFHVSNILSKLNARSRSEAISIAIKNHLVK